MAKLTTTDIYGNLNIHGLVTTDSNFLSIRDTDSAYYLRVVSDSTPTLTANRNLTVDVGNEDRILGLFSDLYVGSDTTKGAITITSNDGNARSLTLEASTTIQALTDTYAVYAKGTNTIGTEPFLNTVRGGTGIGTYAVGDILYANSVTSGAALTKLPIGTVGKIMRTTGSAPSWTTLTMPDTIAAGSIFASNTVNVLEAITSTSGLKALQISGTTISWNTSTGTGNSVFSTSPVLTTPTVITTLNPNTDDGAALGAASLKWSDLFLASAAVINFSNGDITLTHATDTLTFGGNSISTLALGSNHLTMTGNLAAIDSRVTTGYFTTADINTVIANTIARPDANDGAGLGNATYQWSDLFLASGAVINFDGSNVTLTHSAGALTLAGTLALGSNNLTMTGTIASTSSRVATGYFTALDTSTLVASTSVTSPTVQGSTATGGTLLLQSTSHGTKGVVTITGSGVTLSHLATAGAVYTSSAGAISSETYLATSRGGTGAGTFTQGSIVFAGSSGVYTQDNTNFFWDNANDVLRLNNRATLKSYTLALAPATTNFLHINIPGAAGSYGSYEVLVSGHGPANSGNFAVSFIVSGDNTNKDSHIVFEKARNSASNPTLGDLIRTATGASISIQNTDGSYTMEIYVSIVAMNNTIAEASVTLNTTAPTGDTVYANYLGNFGVGTSTPTYKAEVVTSGADVLKLTNSSGSYTLSGTTFTTPTSFSLLTTGATALTLDSGTTGAINIGTGASAKNITIGNVTGATNVTINTGTAGADIIANAVTTDYGLDVTANALTTGSGIRITSAASNINSATSSYGLNISRTGTYLTGVHSVFGIYSSITATNPGTNYGIFTDVSGGASNNWAGFFRGSGGVRTEVASTQDGIILKGRAGGTSNYAVTIIPTTLSASRTLTLANGDTILQAGTMGVTGTSLAQFASTTSAQLAGVISDETGYTTGAVLVFNTSPTFSTSIKLYDSDSTTYSYSLLPGNIGANTNLTLPTTAGYLVITDQSTGKVNLGSTTYVTGTLAAGNGGTGVANSYTLTVTGANKTLAGDGSTITIGASPTINGSGTLALTSNATFTTALTVQTGALTLAAHSSGTTATFPASGSITLVDTATAQTLTNKTIDNILATGAATAADLWSEVTTGSITIGAGLTSGTLNLDASSTGTHSTNLATGITASGNTKTVSIGTAGATGSTTNIVLGSVAGGTTTIYSPNTLISGNLTVDGDLTYVNVTDLKVEDKNIELGVVTVKTGLIATLATGTAVVTLTTGNTNGLIVGQDLTKTAGTGVFGASAKVASIQSITQFTASVNHATAGSITFSTGGASDITADSGGITLKGTTDKTITWDNANDNWTFNQNANIDSGFTYKIANVSVLSATGLGSTVVASSLTSVGTLTSLTVSGAAAFNGTVGLGNAATDVITLTGTIASASGIKIYDSDSTTYTYTILPGNIGANTTLTLPTTAGTFVITDQATGKVNLGSTTYVTGTLPVGNGGTGATNLTSTGILTGNGTSAISAPGPTLTSTVFTFGGAGTINSTTTNALTLDSTTTGAVNLGNSAFAKTITIGNTTGTTSVVVNSGTNGVTFNQVAAGIFKIQASAAPTTDMVQITNTGKPTVTAGVNGLSVTYVGGAAAVEASAIRADITPGTTSGGIWNTFKVASTAAAATGVTMNVFKIDNKTTGDGTSNILYAGTGYDNIINYNGTTVINGTGLVTAGQLSGTIPSGVLGNSSVYIGTTAVALNRTTAALTLAGITLTDGILDNIKASAAATAVDLWSETTTGNVTIVSGLTSGTFTIGATGSTGAVSLFPATGSQAITLGGATTGTLTLGSTLATAVQLPTGKTKIGTTTLAQGGAVTITLPSTAGTLVGSGDTGTVTNTMLAGSIANNKLANSTISGVALGSNLSSLSSGNGLTGTAFNGSAAQTFAVGAGTGITVNADDVAITSIVAGSTTVGALKYNGTTALAGALDGGTTTPTGTLRLNYGGYLYSTRTYSTMIKAGTVGAPVEAVHIAGNLRIDDASDNAGFKMSYNNTSQTLDFAWVGA